MFGEEELIKVHRERSTQIGNIIVMLFMIILMRLWYLQIYKGEVFHEWSIQNRLRKETIQAPRGMIFSRNNELMVDNVPRFDAILVRQFLQNEEKTLKRLSEILNMPIENIRKTIKKNNFQAKYRPIIIKKNITLEEVSKLETENAFLPGVSVDTFISREYRENEIGAHMLGYISEITQDQLPKFRRRDGTDYALGDFIGQFGLEEQMDSVLRGSNGYEFVEVDAMGRQKKYINIDNLFKGINDYVPEPGKNIRLTIDTDMQLAGFNALEGKSGSVVALDVRTGEILAMVSRPSFDPSMFSRGLTSDEWSGLINNAENPLRDRNIQEHYSPGSTFKPITAIAALEEGIIDENTKIRCHGTYTLGRKVYRSWKKSGSGNVNVVDALKESCNIFFYKVGTDLDIDVLAKYAKLFGFGQKTGIALPREVSGLFPTKEWKMKKLGIPWQQGETLSCSIGQSYVLASPLQIATAYAAIANKGKMMKPYLVKEVFDYSGKSIERFEPEIIKEIKLKPKTWDLVHQGLYKVVNDPVGGTAFYRRGVGNQMAGKTGTSQVIQAVSADKLYAKCTEMEYKYRHHGLFVAFAPFEDPHIAVAALVEHGCGGSSAAAPVVEKVVSTYMAKYLPELQKKYAEMEKRGRRAIAPPVDNDEDEASPVEAIDAND